MTSQSFAGGGAASPRSGVLHRRPRLRLGLLLGPPMLWLGVLYLGSLAALFITSLWTVDAFGGNIERIWNLDNYRDLFTIDVYRTITARTILTAVAVTVIDALLAFPIALYMAKVASPRLQRALVIAVLTPLWASYLVKAYAWRGMFASGGPLDDLGLSPGYGLTATVVTLSYLWLPYMILPIFAGLERIPNSLLEASADLGGKGWITFRKVIFPLTVPAIAAGSIFTFSLTLGDYIVPGLVSTTQFIGNVIFVNVAQNLPLAAAYSLVPLAIMLIYLFIVRRFGAFDAL
jgi:putative spermidine/putrescine transport system permease protein